MGILGDLNSRVAAVPDTIENDDIEHNLRQCLEQCFIYPNEPYGKHRKSEDSHINNFGRRLIALCKESGLRILNGRSISDSNGKTTFQRRAGTSVIDYAIIHYGALPIVKYFEVQNFNTFSDHAAIDTVLISRRINTEPDRCTCGCKRTEVNIRTWSNDNIQTINAALEEGKDTFLPEHRLVERHKLCCI